MPIIDQDTKQRVQQELSGMVRTVHLTVYTGGSLVIPGQDGTGQQRETLALLHEIAELSEHVTVSERPIAGDEEAKELAITHAPTILFREEGSTRTNIRFVGLPGGYEFQTLIETLKLLASDAAAAGNGLADLEQPVRVQSFVTPTCPYCPRAVLTAYALAAGNERIVAEGIEANEFPILSQRNRISSVPDTIIQGPAGVERVLGAQPPNVFAEAIGKAAGAEQAAGA